MRKSILMATAAIILVVAGAAPVAAREASAHVATDGPRQDVSLALGWRFKQGEVAKEVVAPGFSDASWDIVAVPHTWNRVGYYIPDTPGRINTADKINKTLGVGWYRLAFTPPKSMAGKRAWLQFDAASRTAEVWLNGVRLGDHKGGFSRFRFDATKTLKPGQENLLVVRTDNSPPSVTSGTADTLPLAGDFFVHGGLYRPVSLIATDPVHIEMLDRGGPGVYATTESIAADQARVAVRSKVRNDASKAARVVVIARLVDAEGRAVARASTAATLAAGQGAELAQTLTIDRPRLWQGVKDPYLHRLQIEVRTTRGRLLDRSEQDFGIRQIRVDPKEGLFLNGQRLPLRGVGLHQDLEGKGWAMSTADIEADVALIRDMGANSIRLTHYQHGETIHRLADRYGLILWDEIPLVTMWTTARGQKEATPGLLADARQQMQELIRQNYNHASVAVWGLANELDFGASLPGFLTGGIVPPDPLPLLAELNTLAKVEDPTRPTTQANCCEGRLFAGDVEVPTVAPAADLNGVNRYFGWYYGRPEDFGPHLDATRRKRPDQPLAVTEYGAGGAITLHTDDPRGGPPDSRGRNQPEEYQSYIHEQAWDTILARPYLWGTWIWNSFDFATTVRREGDANDINTKGLVTYDRKTKKDAFFFYKANWSQAPTLHITGRRYVDRAYPVTDIRVYSNAATTELRLNGASLGAKSDCPLRVCVWSNVQLAVGQNLVEASAIFPTGLQQDRITWTLAADAVGAWRIDSGALMSPQAASPRFGSDAFFTGGEAASLNKPSDYGKPAEKRTIVGAPNAEIAATFRTGDFHYRLPLRDGRYEVTLTFVEPEARPGQRTFDVLADDVVKLEAFDIAAAAAAPLTVVQRRFSVEVHGGLLDLHFKPRAGNALVSSVEIASEP
jgi:beta-galactosidase